MSFKQRSPLPIIEGGTNTQSFVHAFGVAYYDGGALNNISPGTSGYVLTSNGTSAPSFQPSSAVNVVWNDVIATPVTMAAYNGYVSDDGGNVVVATLPPTAVFGAIIYVVGGDSGLGWSIAQNAGQKINFGPISTTVGVGGSLSSTDISDCVTLICTVANTTFTVINSVGNLIYV